MFGQGQQRLPSNAASFPGGGPPSRSASGAFGGAASLFNPGASSGQQPGAGAGSAGRPFAPTPGDGLDTNDFPALGGAPASAGGGAFGTSAFLNTYASQAQAASLPTPVSSIVSGIPPSRDFTADDFPALGGRPLQQSAVGRAPGSQLSSSAGGAGMQAAIAQMVNGTAPGPGAGAGTVAGAPAGGPKDVSAEQASAAAALAVQRGSIGSQGAPPQPLPPPAGQPPSQDESKRSFVSSPTSSAKPSSTAVPPSPSAAAAAATATFHALTNGSSIASTPLPPPSAGTNSAAATPGLRSPSGSIAGLSLAGLTNGGLSSIGMGSLPPPGPPSVGSATGTPVTPAAAPGSSSVAGLAGLRPLTASSSTGLPPPSVASSVSGGAPVASGVPLLPQTPAQQVLFSPADRYGLLGLLSIIKMADSDLGMLALGTDLTTLGLDLGASDNLYSTFITPWSDSHASATLNIEPDFVLPSCYNVSPPPAQTKISNFSDETLFFIFYSAPRDAMQEMAAHELYRKNWRYHKELRLWLTKEAGTEPSQKTSTYEKGSYIFFDPTLWARVRKDFVLVFENLEQRLF